MQNLDSLSPYVLAGLGSKIDTNVATAAGAFAAVVRTAEHLRLPRSFKVHVQVLKETFWLYPVAGLNLSCLLYSSTYNYGGRLSFRSNELPTLRSCAVCVTTSEHVRLDSPATLTCPFPSGSFLPYLLLFWADSDFPFPPPCPPSFPPVLGHWQRWGRPCQPTCRLRCHRLHKRHRERQGEHHRLHQR